MKPEKQKKHAALRALLIALLTLALLAAGFAAYRFWRLPRAGFAVHFVDIGQGDAAIVVCDGKTLVIDGGMPESGAKLVDYLQNTLHVSICVSLSKLKLISSSIIGSLNLMDLSH